MASSTSAEPVCLYDVYLSNPYSINNPEGIIDLSTAENRLLSNMIVSEIERHTNLKDPSILNYGPAGASSSLCSAFKDFMLQICKIDIDENKLTMISGAEIAIQILLQVICKAGDKVAVATPCYPGFAKAIHRLGLHLCKINIDLNSEIEMPDVPKDVQAIIISNPDVPTGRCWSRSALQALIKATKTSGQHLIVDEVVSTAVFKEDSFTSAASFFDDRVHVILGLSKIGMAGLRIGAIYTERPRSSITDLSRVAQIGSIEQQLAANLLADRAFVSNLMKTSRACLHAAYAIAVDRLDAERIEYKLGTAGLTVLLNLGVDFSPNQLITDSKVLLKPLTEFGSRRQGWFRMTVADNSQVVATAIQRVSGHLRRQSPLSLSSSYTNLFTKLWKRTEQLWAILQADAKWPDSRPIQLRHPFVFYVGHLPAFAMNQICLAIGEANVLRVNGEYDKLFERGIDPDVLSGEVHPHSADINRSSWPSIIDINRYVESVHERILQSLPMLLACGHFRIVEMVLEHEQMHQETLIYMMSQCEPSQLQCPVGILSAWDQSPTTKQRLCRIPTGNASLGCEGSVTVADRFGWDNEFPKVMIHVNEFNVMSLPVSNGEFLRFINSGGYSNSALWLDRHWKWVQTDSITHPASWRFDENSRQWLVRTSLFKYSPLDQVSDYPVMVSYAEASAYSRYAGARIMTEPEYHRAAYGDNVSQPYPWGYLPPAAVNANVDFQAWSLRPSGIGNTESCFGVADLVGQAWEWTSSKFSPLDPNSEFATMPTYQGYSSEFFDGKHVVMKGGSWATDRNLMRPSFRNWYQDCYHYSFGKFRLVHDAKSRNGSADKDFIRLIDNVNLKEQRHRFSSHIKAGLMSIPKTIHSMYFYDNRGSEIYAKITELDEYYLTKTEAQILNTSANQIADLLHDHQLRYNKCNVNVVEFGAGDGEKTIRLLKRLYANNIDLRYFPIDISEGALLSLQEKLRWNNCEFKTKFILGDNIHGLEYLSKEANGSALTFVLFLGSSIGNYSRLEASQVLQSMRSKLKPGDLAMIGFDLVKSTDIMLPAYDDKQGITAEFNYNLIRRLNGELNAQIPLDVFSHYATYNPTKRRMESYLIATRPLKITLSAGNHYDEELTIIFDAWEPVHVENSYKYTLNDIKAFGETSGFQLCRNLFDDKQWFSDTIFRVA